MSVNSRLKATKIILRSRKAFIRQRIPESKKNVDIEICVTSRNGDRKIMQFIRIIGRYFQVQSPYYQAAQCNHKTPIPVSSR